jgi:Zn-dependent M28 family amino/carboxypeptidase
VTARRRRRLLVLAAIVLLPLTAAAILIELTRSSSDEQRSVRREPRPGPGGGESGVAGMLEHLRAFERIADRHDGNRAAGTAGDRASVRYVAERLRRAGYRVRLESVRFPYFAERGRPQLRLASGSRERLGEVRTLHYSGGGRVTAPLQPLALAPDAGCERADFDGFRRGRIALIQRGTCTLREKVVRARRAGAAAAIVFNDGRPGRTGTIAGTLIRPGAAIPAVFVGSRTGRELVAAGGRRLRVRVDAVSETRTTRNVLAESAAGAGKVVMAGAHLDSVNDGPGINDNGSGVAVVLEAAETLARGGPARRPLRFALWGAEEVGLVGSRRYVRGLSQSERSRIAAYLNLDMVGSPNGGRFAYGAASGPVAPLLGRSLAARGIRVERRPGLGGGSDHAPFERAGVPVGGLFSGAARVKSREEQRAWGGRAGRPFDRCYHRACDDLGNIDRRALAELGTAAISALRDLSR